MNAPATLDIDVRAELYGLLEERWAMLPAENDGEELAWAFVRAAYGRGYVEGLENGEQP